MKSRFAKMFLLLMLSLSILFAACGETTVIYVTVEATLPPVVVTEVVEVEAPTRTPKPTKTPILVGPIATANALSQQITLIPPTAIGGSDLPANIAPDDYVNIFRQAWYIVKASYVRDNYNGTDWDAVYDEYLPKAEQVTSSEELWVLLSALIGELNDNHSRFVPPSRMEAEFGVGEGAEARPTTGMYVWPSRDDDKIFVWCVTPGSPADRAGITRGDVILAVDGEEIIRGEEGFTREQRIEIFYGTGGETTVYTIQQGPDVEPKDFTLSFEFVGGCDGWIYGIVNNAPRIGYIRVLDFDGNAAFNIQDAIDTMEADQPLDGLIVDIRHNPGGRSDESMKIFAMGIIGTEGALREDSTRIIYRIHGPVGWSETTPMVVLTDGNSHSAADYFAAGMRALDRATLIGMPTAGNTEGITGFSLADGTLIRMAVSSILLEDGSSIEGVGVIPDIEVPLGDWGFRQTPFDLQLQTGIDYLVELIGD